MIFLIQNTSQHTYAGHVFIKNNKKTNLFYIRIKKSDCIKNIYFLSAKPYR